MFLSQRKFPAQEVGVGIHNHREVTWLLHSKVMSSLAEVKGPHPCWVPLPTAGPQLLQQLCLPQPAEVPTLHSSQAPSQLRAVMTALNFLFKCVCAQTCIDTHTHIISRYAHSLLELFAAIGFGS